MENLDTMYTDATYYESDMRYPTDAKLMWDGVEKSYAMMCELSSRLGIHRPFGEKKKEKDLVRKELARVWATAIEGSFGTQKEHYDLRRVKDRTKRTRNPVYLLRYPYGKRSVVGGQDRTKSASGVCLTRRHAVSAELLRGNYILAMDNRQKIRSKRPESDKN